LIQNARPTLTRNWQQDQDCRNWKLYTEQSRPGRTLISDPAANLASVPHNAAQLLAQAMASFGASSGIAGSGTGNLAKHHRSSDFLAANSHHG